MTYLSFSIFKLDLLRRKMFMKKYFLYFCMFGQTENRDQIKNIFLLQKL